ncbi:alpha-N-acetylglucosaminidase [Shewanella sp. C32]|uniref:Alpha-N-acetylglucosaminidase n=1 Tax=Shewanella electrica TaxID=515560 RepID=A0ABT2FIG7_9GAMM|nr:alpha-N-acetylglucosaminidase [Shewanella electrica]MCH1925206.1 alpha-N-acetylglucosaminidase [Shewanella electrica]MCS4555031.1 alpha-N-acetylglucosaminidase [Shewanella electrica]
MPQTSSQFFSTLGLMMSLSVTFASQAAAPVSSDASAAKAVLQRVTGSPLSHVDMTLVSDNNTDDWYQVSAQHGVLNISGNSNNAITYGAYQYLRSQGSLSVSWEGKRVALPQNYADVTPFKVSSPFAERAYLNVCAYGYTTPWWDWSRWQQEIDWMAIHGVNNPVAMEGQEYVWQQLWREFGVADQQLADYFSGPAFAPWQRMGNIEGHQGPLPQSWIDKKHQLQLKILGRMAELGMEPVVPAFSGYVPKQFKTLFPDAKIYEMPKWSGFAHETYWLDPADPLFAKVAKRFIELYTQAYGKHKYYLSDAFNEMLPPVSKTNREADLADYGQRLYQSIHQAAPEATWVMQGWMFGADQAFWDDKAVAAFLSKIPDDKMMIHDIGNDRFHVWQGTDGFKGKPWIFGFIHNYGGSDPIYGDFGDYVTQLNTVTTAKNAGDLQGFGVFPEGLHSNSIVYEFLFDLPWQQQPDINQWYQQYSQARYGKSTAELQAAWPQLVKGVYQVAYWHSRWWEGSAGAYLLMKRPTAATAEFPAHPGDLTQLDTGINQWLSFANDYANAPLFQYDLVDLVKQSVSLHSDALLQQAVAAYQAGDINAGDAAANKFAVLLTKLDKLMGLHQETLHTWLSDAAAYGDNPQEKSYYVHNAKLQITQWGGTKLKDYASKAWQGMYADYYLPRWQLYLQQLRQAQISKQPLDDAAAQQALIDWETHWINDPSIPAQEIPHAPVTLARELMQLVAK